MPHCNTHRTTAERDWEHEIYRNGGRDRKKRKCDAIGVSQLLPKCESIHMSSVVSTPRIYYYYNKQSSCVVKWSEFRLTRGREWVVFCFKMLSPKMQRSIRINDSHLLMLAEKARFDHVLAGYLFKKSNAAAKWTRRYFILFQVSFWIHFFGVLFIIAWHYGLHNEWMDVGKQQIAYFLTFHPKRVNSIFGSIIIMQWFLIWTSAQCRIWILWNNSKE